MKKFIAIIALLVLCLGVIKVVADTERSKTQIEGYVVGIRNEDARVDVFYEVRVGNEYQLWFAAVPMSEVFVEEGIAYFSKSLLDNPEITKVYNQSNVKSSIDELVGTQISVLDNQ